MPRYFNTIFIILLCIIMFSCKEKTVNIVQQAAIEQNLAENDSAVIIDAVVENPNQVENIRKDENKIEESAKVTIETKSNVPSKPKSVDIINTTEDRIVKPEIVEKVKDVSNGVKNDIPTSSDNNTDFINHDSYSRLLSKNVSNTGVVNYKSFKKDESILDEYLKEINDFRNVEKMSYEEKLSFWINVYNAHTIKLVLKNYPIKSIKDLYGGEPWDHRWVKVNTTTYSLNEIENEIIRKKFGEPRIHFALNCAAKSCPPLSNKAFTAVNLSSLLAQNTKSFINSKENLISKSKLQLSQIFDWYKVDFGNVVDFISKYSTVKPQDNAEISFKKYDWSLNE